jgi:hypothetical protein
MDWLEMHWWQLAVVAVVVLLWRIASLLAELRRDVEEVFKTLWLLPALKGQALQAKEMRENGAFPDLTRPKETR